MITNLKKSQDVLRRYYINKDLAFIFGNGINRYNNDNSSNSWSSLLLDVWDAISSRTMSVIDKGITMTEFYNIMEFEAKSSQKVRQKTVEIVKSWKPSSYEKALKNRLIDIDCPVLTTNFDNNIDQGLQRFVMKDNQGFSDYYPWNVYYSNKRLSNPLDGFGVWHINGVVDYPRSLRLSLSEYINQSSRTRKYIHSDDTLDNFARKSISNWNGYHTWLHLVFNSNLCIIGLGLDEQETFLRWLLIERMMYFYNYNERKKKGWYVCCKDDIKDSGKKLFLDYLGFEIICLPNYKSIYEDLLGI